MTSIALPDGAGTVHAFLGTTMTVKASGADTGDALTLIEQECPPGFATPTHVHHHDDEAFYVLAGGMRVRFGDDTWEAGQGSFVLLPRGRPHGFAVTGTQPLRLLQITWPAGFEHFAAAVAALPPDSSDPATLIGIAARHGYEITGPPSA